MTDDLALLQQLRATPDLLAAVATCSPTERVRQKSLRGRFPDELVRAVGRLPHAEQLWLTRTGLEQATAWDVARHKAARFAGCGDVVDLCCGIGSDAAALSHHGQVMAVDRCPAMVMRAAWNTEVLGKPERFTAQCGNVTAEDWTGRFVHADPDRRDGE
jgi:SAM-dependent methyltransferase